MPYLASFFFVNFGKCVTVAISEILHLIFLYWQICMNNMYPCVTSRYLNNLNIQYCTTTFALFSCCFIFCLTVSRVSAGCVYFLSITKMTQNVLAFILKWRCYPVNTSFTDSTSVIRLHVTTQSLHSYFTQWKNSPLYCEA